jgi:hypothetical protein
MNQSADKRFELDTESMNYKKILRKSKDAINGTTKESVIFSVVSTAKKVKVSFTFVWSYDAEDGFSYKAFHDFSGHKRYSKEEQEWLETYCKTHFPDSHHMSY